MVSRGFGSGRLKGLGSGAQGEFRACCCDLVVSLVA